MSDQTKEFVVKRFLLDFAFDHEHFTERNLQTVTCGLLLVFLYGNAIRDGVFFARRRVTFSLNVPKKIVNHTEAVLRCN